MMAETKVWHFAPDTQKIEENNYQDHIIQINGQLTYTSPVLDEPPKGTEIFISKIPCDLKIEELLPVVQRCGPVYSLRLMMEFSGKNRTFAFARYADVESAKEAVKYISGYEIIPFCFLKATRSLDNCRLFIGQIHKNLRKETLFDLLSQETEGLKDVILYLSSTDKTMNRGFCFAEYVNHRAAAMARRKLISFEKLWNLCPCDASLKVDWAIPEDHVDEEVMAKVTILYVRNMMLKTTESSLREVLYRMVPPHEIGRVCKQQDYAFIHFKERSVAEKVLSYLQGFILDGAILDVSWAKPPLPERKKDENKKLLKKLQTENGLASQKNIVHKCSPLLQPQVNLPGVNLVNQPYINPIPFSIVASHPTTLPKGEMHNNIGAKNGLTIGQTNAIPLATPTSYIFKSELIFQVFNEYLVMYPPAFALKQVFQYFQWGTVQTEIFQQPTIENRLLYCCQIWSKYIPFCPVMAHGKTPEEASNNAAIDFFKKNFNNNTFYNIRLPLRI